MSSPDQEEFERRYLGGDELWGDDFDDRRIEEWFEDEREAYASLAASYDRASGGRTVSQEYESINLFHGFSRIDLSVVDQVLAIGGFDGGELSPILRPGMSLTILDPSDAPRAIEDPTVAVDWRKPDPSGDMSFPDRSFDLVTCFGVLHHIPNVSHVIREIGRVLKPGAVALIREPISSMGDWRQPRPGMTKRERGIPPNVFKRAFSSAGLSVQRESYCMFAGTAYLGRLMGRWPYSNTPMVRLDAALSRATLWNYRYSPQSRFQRIRPGAVAYVVQKE